MPVKESSATALVRFTGLGIICFNRERGRGEIAAIRDDKHTLSVCVQRPVFQDGGGADHITYEDVAAYTGLPKEGVRIEIAAEGSPAVEGFEIYQGGGDFDRLDSPDPNDFRWIVNMDALHGDAVLGPAAEGRHPLTRIYVGNGLFYTHKLDTSLAFEKVCVDAAGAEAAREVFGNVAETVGVVIEGEEVTVKVSVGGRAEAHTLRRVEGLPFRVEIKNMDYADDAVYSDMADYYGYVASPDGTKFDLAPLLEDGDTESINQKVFCHPVTTTGLSSIDEL